MPNWEKSQKVVIITSTPGCVNTPLPVDLYELTLVCRRLAAVASDGSLWRHVDTTSKPLPVTHFRRLLKFLCDRTIKIVVGGFLNQRNKMHLESVTPAILVSSAQMSSRPVF
jgi:hypothetical protein